MPWPQKSVGFWDCPTIAGAERTISSQVFTEYFNPNRLICVCTETYGAVTNVEEDLLRLLGTTDDIRETGSFL